MKMKTNKDLNYTLKELIQKWRKSPSMDQLETISTEYEIDGVIPTILEYLILKPLTWLRIVDYTREIKEF